MVVVTLPLSVPLPPATCKVKPAATYHFVVALARAKRHMMIGSLLATRSAFRPTAIENSAGPRGEESLYGERRRYRRRIASAAGLHRSRTPPACRPTVPDGGLSGDQPATGQTDGRCGRSDLCRVSDACGLEPAGPRPRLLCAL